MQTNNAGGDVYAMTGEYYSSDRPIQVYSAGDILRIRCAGGPLNKLPLGVLCDFCLNNGKEGECSARCLPPNLFCSKFSPMPAQEVSDKLEVTLRKP